MPITSAFAQSDATPAGDPISTALAFLPVVVIFSLLFLWKWPALKRLWGVGVVGALESGTVEFDITRQARALGFLRLSEHWIVFSLGVGSAVIVSRAIFRGAPGDLWDLPLAALYGWAAFTGFRHSGVIDPRVWRSSLLPFTLVLLAGIALSWVFLRRLFREPLASGDPMLAAWSYLVTAATAALGLCFVVVLLRSRISGLDLTAGMLIRELDTRQRGQAPSLTKLKRIAPTRGAILGVCAGLMILGPVLVIALSEDSALRTGFGVLLLVGYSLAQRSRRYFQVSADSLLAADRRPPILFLRSFDDDELQSAQTPDKALLDYSLETRLANHFMKFGPFVAVGSPKDAVPQLGASRARLQDNEWQSQVLSWMKEAEVIVMYAGKTHWVKWELERLIETGCVSRLILLIPEIRAWSKGKRYRELAQRAAQLRLIFRGTPWGEQIDGWWDYVSLRALVFCADGSLVVVKSASRSRDSFHLATLVAQYVLTQPPAPNSVVVAPSSGMAA